MDTLVLRKVYALDSNTGLFLSTNNILMTDGKGGTSWNNLISSLTIAGGTVIGNLPSTLSTVSSGIWANTSNISVLTYTIATQNPGQITQTQLVSTVGGLGSASYISTSQLTSTVSLLIQRSQLNSTINGLGTFGYISSSYQIDSNVFTSTVAGLSDSGYISTSQLMSTVRGLPNANIISTAALTSTVLGLPLANFISTAALTSTVLGLPNARFISTAALTSTINGLGNFYISTAALVSTTQGIFNGITSTSQGLGNIGYVSTASLVSTTQAVTDLTTKIQFDNTGTVYVNNCQVFFSTVSQVTFLSSFFYSTVQPTSATSFPFGSQGTALGYGNSNLEFSSIAFDLSPFSNYIVSTSKISLELYPNFLFTRIGSGATAPAMLPISTMIQYGANLLSTVNTSYLFAQTQNLSYSVPTAGSNLYNTPIRMEIPPSSVNAFASPYVFYHYMPGSLTYGGNVNALHNSTMICYKPNLFVSVQNLPN